MPTPRRSSRRISPPTTAHRLAPDAMFYIGETYMQRSRPREAAEQYLKVSTEYSKSPRAPEGMVRLGLSLAMLGNNEQACATFAEVGRRYPTASTHGEEDGRARDAERPLLRGARLSARGRRASSTARSAALLLAVSGGPDSTALLLMARAMGGRRGASACTPRPSIMACGRKAPGKRPPSRQLAARLGVPHGTLRWEGPKAEDAAAGARARSALRLLAADARRVGARRRSSPRIISTIRPRPC